MKIDRGPPLRSYSSGSVVASTIKSPLKSCHTNQRTAQPANTQRKMKFVILCALIAVASAHYLPSYHQGGHISGKAAFRGDIYFDGCYETTCHKDGFDGYGCKAGRCAYICHPKGCYESHAFSETSAESWGEQEGYGKRFEKGGSKGQSQYKGHVQFSGRVDFSGCSSEHCHSGEYEGYDCKDGHCATVCKGSECHEEKEYGYGYGY
ncbi:hypothetical protein AAHC03_013583 [Spirometra sp. Aus1]